MDEQTKNKITQLENDIADLTKKYNALLNFSTIPLEFEQALIKRGFINVAENELLLYHEGGVGGNLFTNKYRVTKYRNKYEYLEYVDGVKQFTVNTTTDVVNLTNHGYVDGQYLNFQTTDTLPAGLDSLIDTYLVLNATANTFQVTIDGVNPVDITSAGTGDQYVNTY